MEVVAKARKKYKPRTRPRPRTKYAKTIIREQRLAAYLAAGLKHTDACRKAGFPESVLKTGAIQIVNRPSVQKLLAQQHADLVEVGRAINIEDLGSVAKARVREGVVKFKANQKEGKLLLGFSRTAGEMSGLLGGPSELHLHEGGHRLCPEAARMIAEEVLRMQAEANAITDEGISVNERPLLAETVQPEPVQPQPKDSQPIDISPARDTEWEKEQMERFTADYQRKHGLVPRR